MMEDCTRKDAVFFILRFKTSAYAGVFSFLEPRGVVGMKMPDKDLGLLAWLLAWADTHWPALYGFILSVTISWLRVTYSGGGFRQRLLESLLCGAISLSVMSGMELFGIAATASGFVGGSIGFLGVEKIREFAGRVLDRRFGNGPS